MTVGDQYLVQPHSQTAGLCTGLESHLRGNCFPLLSTGIQKLRYSFSFPKTAVKYNSGAQRYCSLETVKYYGQNKSHGKNQNCSTVTNPMVATQDFQGTRQNLGACGGIAFSYSIIWDTLGLHGQNGEDKNLKSHYPGILAWLGRLSSSSALVDLSSRVSAAGDAASCTICLHLCPRGQALQTTLWGIIVVK